MESAILLIAQQFDTNYSVSLINQRHVVHLCNSYIVRFKVVERPRDKLVPVLTDVEL